MRTIFIQNSKRNQKLVNYICHTFPNLSYSVLQKSLRNKDIKLNGKRITSDQVIKNGDKVDIYIQDLLLFNLPICLDCVYEDENILAIFKPQGILSNNEEKLTNEQIRKIGGLEPTLEDLVVKIYPNAKICHRLDRNTSGVILFSKNDASYKELLNGFKNSLIAKTYIAYVANAKFDQSHAILEKYILKDKNTGYSKIYNHQVPNSQKIITEYTVLKTNQKLDFAILKIQIHTGKTHQIRAQLMDIFHPIIGDPKYGSNDINKKFQVHKQLLYAIEYTFSFHHLSPLCYLNDCKISCDSKYYTNKIGRDKNEENTKT